MSNGDYYKPPPRPFMQGTQQQPQQWYPRETETGIKYFQWSIMLALLSLLLLFIAAIVMFVAISGLNINIALLGAILGMFCGLLIMLLIAFIFMILGLATVYSGKHEFGAKLQSSVGKGVMFFVLSLVFYIIMLVMMFMPPV